MPEALVRSLEKEVGMFLILVQTFRFLSSALRLTTFMTTIRDCPLKSPKVRNQGDAPGADAQVKGGAVAGQHGEKATAGSTTASSNIAARDSSYVAATASSK